MRLKIKVPATSGNLGPGFDCLGIALTLYNEFYFERSKNWEFVGFNEKFANSNNLVVQAIKRTYEYARTNIPCFKISIVQCVPISRGLGSSSTCIVAGVMAANYFLDNKFTKNEILNIATSIEGHPDNVAPAIYGSLVGSYMIDDMVRFIKYPVAEDLQFTVAIPNFSLSTKEAREVLPDSLSYSDVIHTMSRAINIPHALATGDLKMLYELLNDKIHEPYRFPLIDDSDKFKEIQNDYKVPFCISGSGSTLLFISKEKIGPLFKELDLKYRWQFIGLSVNQNGATIETIV